MQVDFFFTGWRPVVRILLVGPPMYVALVAFMRLSGSRTIANVTVFDFVVTVAIGAAFGGSLTAEGVALVEAVTAFGLLIGLQYAVAWLQIRVPAVRRGVTNDPTLLYYRGRYLRDAMRDQRMTEDELQSAVRKAEVGSMAEVDAVVLESTGDVSVVTDPGDESALPDSAEDRPRGPEGGQ